MFKFSAKAVHLVGQYMAQQDLRYYLNGIYAEPALGGGAFIVATDGHQMAVYYDADALCTQPVLFSLTKAGISACKPKRNLTKHFVQINPITQRLIVMGSKFCLAAEEMYIQPGKCFIDGKFPDWKRVMKPFCDGKPVESVSVNSEYVAKFFSATKHHCGTKFQGLKMYFKSETDAIVLRNGYIPEFQVLLMPMREHDTGRLDQVLFNTLKAYTPPETIKTPGAV